MPRIKGLFRSLPYLTQERPPMGGQFNASSSFTSTTKNHATHCNIPCRNSELMAHQPYMSRHRRCQGYAPVFLGIPKIWKEILVKIYRCISKSLSKTHYLNYHLKSLLHQSCFLYVFTLQQLLYILCTL